ncbi:MAG TPA: chromate transporter, partial [Candidatus Hydrogenedentes bacterium]|nr:chromate transporter [Candidatus Hydrogenedentota bacterium]
MCTAAQRISLANLFWTFFRIGLLTFGGGVAMAAVMRYELVLKRRWLGEDDFVSAMSAATAVPGVIAVNLAFLQGQRFRGLPGAGAAVLGTI